MDTTAKLWCVERGVELYTLAVSASRDCQATSQLFVPPSRDTLPRSSALTSAPLEIKFSRGHSTTLSPFGPLLMESKSLSRVLCPCDVTCLHSRRLFTLIGHRAEISNAVFNFSGSVIATGSMDHSCKLWDSGSGRIITTLRGHKDEVLDVSFDMTGQRLATASADGEQVSSILDGFVDILLHRDCACVRLLHTQLPGPDERSQGRDFQGAVQPSRVQAAHCQQ